MRGLVHVYTGDGKGKTTAALGLAFRAVGCGFRVVMIQFLKDSPTGELESCQKFGSQFQILRFHEGHKGFFWNMDDSEKREFRQEVCHAFSEAETFLHLGACDMLILDEILGCVQNGFISEEELCRFIQKKPEQLELILTGRNAPECVTSLADYVSEICAVKHPMDSGTPARRGIEF